MIHVLFGEFGVCDGGWKSQWDLSSTTSQNNTVSSQATITTAVVYVHTAGHAGPPSRPDAALLIIHLH